MPDKAARSDSLPGIAQTPGAEIPVRAPPCKPRRRGEGQTAISLAHAPQQPDIANRWFDNISASG